MDLNALDKRKNSVLLALQSSECQCGKGTECKHCFRMQEFDCFTVNMYNVLNSDTHSLESVSDKCVCVFCQLLNICLLTLNYKQ